MGLAGFGVSFSIDMPLLTELRSHRDNMNDDQLNHLLKSARVPDREPVYWDEFPSHVRRQWTASITRRYSERPGFSANILEDLPGKPLPEIHHLQRTTDPNEWREI